MDIEEIQEKTTEFCQKLYKNNEISYEELKKCLGEENKVYQTVVNADKHRFAVKGDGTASNFENNLIYIYHYEDGKKQYITASSTSLTLNDGVYVKDDATFIIEKVTAGNYALKNMGSSKYATYDGLTGKLSLEDKITSNAHLKIFSYTNEENENMYKLVFSKYNKVLGIENNDVLKLYNIDNDYTWNFEIQPEGIVIYEFDPILDEIAIIVEEYERLSYEYKVLYTKLEILKNLNSHILSVYNNVFDILYNYQSGNQISISRYSLEKAKDDNLLLYEETKKYLIDEKIIATEREMTKIKNKLQEYAIQYDEKVQIITNKTNDVVNETENIESQIAKFNKLLENNNVFIDVNKFEESKLKDKNNLLKAEINKSVDEIKNGSRTRTNLYFNIVIGALLLVIIAQLVMKVI